MIGRILYRESVQGVLNYVFGKGGSTILGFQNTISEFNTPPKFFANVLHFQGQRHVSANRYVHITLNLPHGEHLNNETFYKLAQDYMNEMGYREQPYVVVRHHDTIHEHIHIVSTTITDDGGMVNLSYDFRRNVATQKYLEKSFGLSPSPETKSQRELPNYRAPELQFRADESNGTKFYVQDVLNSMLQRYKVRSFDELALLVKPYHIVLRTMTNENGRVGVAYGIDNQKQYKTQFINGYTVHPKLSGPKLNAFFERSAKSKLLPMHKKRLEKQMLTTFTLFKTMRHEDLPDVLKSYQKIDCQLVYGRKQQLSDIIIYDKSGYVFKASDISQTDFANHPQLMDNTSGVTRIDDSGKQFQLEVKKLIKNGFYTSYLGANKSNMLLSEFVMTHNLKDLLPTMASSEPYSFLHHYSENKSLPKAIQKAFETVRNELCESETKKEIEALEAKVGLLQKILEKPIFDSANKENNTFYLLQSLGLKYGNGRISYMNSNRHSVQATLGKYPLPKTNRAYLSSGVVNQNQKVLEMLVGNPNGKDAELNATALFLPLMLPELYHSMTPENMVTFEAQSLKAYHKSSERFHIQFEKSPVDYIKLFNAKGFCFEQKQDKLYIRSIYSKLPVNIVLAPKTQTYLKSIKNLDSLLTKQPQTLSSIEEKGTAQLKNLWVSHLIEKQLYGKAAFMMVNQGIRPNLHSNILEHHLENGLRQKILEVSKQKMNSQQASILRKSVYAFSALLGGNGYKEEEVFNGFKDELTDYSKRRGLFI